MRGWRRASRLAKNTPSTDTAASNASAAPNALTEGRTPWAAATRAKVSVASAMPQKRPRQAQCGQHEQQRPVASMGARAPLPSTILRCARKARPTPKGTLIQKAQGQLSP
jgi:hypothetical protein